MSENKSTHFAAPVVLVTDSKSFDIIRIVNPFDVRQHVKEAHDWSPELTIAECIEKYEGEFVASINGRIIEKNEWGLTHVSPGDNLVICPVPQGGGGGGKSIVRLVAMIAVAVYAPYLVNAIAGDSFVAATAGTFAATPAGMMVTAGVTIAGSMLVNAMLPVSPIQGPSSTFANSRSYGIDGPKNSSLEAIAVPVCYGKFRMAGNLINGYVENYTTATASVSGLMPISYGKFGTTSADDSLPVGTDSQMVYLLYNAGEGPVSMISDIEVNDQPIANYTQMESAIRLGLPSQTSIPWFASVIVPISKQLKLTTDWIYHTTTDVIDQARFDVVFPNGLAKIDSSSGNTEAYSVELEIEARPASTELINPNDWTPLTTPVAIVSSASHTVHHSDSKTFSNVEGTLIGALVVNPTTAVTSLASSTATGGNTTLSDLLASKFGVTTGPSISNILVTKDSWADGSMPPDAFSTRTISVSWDEAVADTSGPGGSYTITEKSRSAVRRSLFTPKSSVRSKYEFRIRRKTPKQTDSTYLDECYLSDVNEINFDDISYNNTALVGIKIALSDQISGMPTVTYLNHGVVINAPLGSNNNANPANVAWDILTNTRYGAGFATSRIDIPKFTEWAAYCDLNELEFNGVLDQSMNVWDVLQYVFRCGHAQIVNIGTRFSVAIERADTPVMMFGMGNIIEGSFSINWLPLADRANEIEVQFFDYTNKYKQTAIKAYDFDRLNTGEPQKTSTVTLYGIVGRNRADKEIQLLLNMNKLIRQTVTFDASIDAIACTIGDLIYVQHDMPDWGVAGRLEAGCTTGTLILDRPVTMEAGKMYKALVLMDGDIIAERDVMLQVGTTTSITLQQTLAVAPAQFTNFMFGETAKVKKTFRIKSISGSSDHTRTIQAIEYNPAVYNLTDRVTDYDVVTNGTMGGGVAIISQVRFLGGYEEFAATATGSKDQIYLTWDYPLSGNYAGADIYMSVAGETLKNVGSVGGSSKSYVTDAIVGQLMKFKVVAYDINGKRAPYDAAPEYTITPTGINANPPKPGDTTGVTIFFQGKDCNINWRLNSTTKSYEFGSEPLGADAGTADPNFKDWEVKILTMNGTVLRTEYVTAPHFVYTFDMNWADTQGHPNRQFMVEICVRTTDNRLGNPGTVEAYNPPPIIDCSQIASVGSFDGFSLQYTKPADPDYVGAMMWMSMDNAVEMTANNLVYDGPDTKVQMSGLIPMSQYFVRIVGYDAFGKYALIDGCVVVCSTTKIDAEAIANDILKDSMLVPELRARINLIDDPFTVAGSVNQRLQDQANTLGAAITTESSARQAADSSIASQLNTLTAALNANTAAITTEQTARVNADGSLATQLNVVQATTNSNTSAINAETTARTNADSALSTQISTLSANVASSMAAIQTEATARATADSANAFSISTLQTTVGANTAAISVQQSSIDGLSGQYTVKIDNDGYVSGFGLASTTVNGTPVSEFIIRADKFSIATPTGPTTENHPFTIGQVNGQPKVVMRSTLIEDAAINTAKISDLSVTTLKIGDNAVTVPMNVVAYPNVTHAKNTLNANEVVSAWQWLDSSTFISALITVDQQVLLNNDMPLYSRCSMVARLTNVDSVDGYEFCRQSVSIMDTEYQSSLFSSAIQVPYSGWWRVEISLGNDGQYYVNGDQIHESLSWVSTMVILNCMAFKK
jgi:predicted phage tail protein